MNKKSSRPNRRSLIILASAVVVISAVLLIVSIIKGSGMPEFVRVIFGIKQEEETETVRTSVPDISPNSDEEKLSYFDYSAEEMLLSLKEKESYHRTLRIISSYEDKRKVTAYSIDVNGKTFKTENSSSTVTFDGEQLHVRSSVAEFTSNVSADVYSEVGITSLEELMLLLGENEHKLSYGNDKRTVKIILYNDNGKPTAEYEVSIENGIVITEYHYKNGEIYRAVVTDSVTDYSGEDIAIAKG